MIGWLKANSSSRSIACMIRRRQARSPSCRSAACNRRELMSDAITTTPAQRPCESSTERLFIVKSTGRPSRWRTRTPSRTCGRPRVAALNKEAARGLSSSSMNSLKW
jgi:hypothetical protein